MSEDLSGDLAAKKRRHVYCSVNVCKSPAKATYHRFPKDEEVKRAWIKACNKDGDINPATARVCSVHFCSDDYEVPLKNRLMGLSMEKKIKLDAVPCLMLDQKIKVEEIRPTSKRQNEFTIDEMIRLYDLKYQTPLPSSSKVTKPADEELILENKNLKTRLKKLKTLSDKRHKKIIDQKKEIVNLKNVITHLNSPKMAYEITKNHLLKTHSVAQTEKILHPNKKKIRGYSEEDVATALVLKSISPKAFNYLKSKNLMALPSRWTQQRWIDNYGIDAGVLQDSLEILIEMSGYELKYTLAALPRTERGSPMVLGADPKGKNFLYAHGNSVIIRSLDNPEISDVYTQHSCQVNVAKYSPSGFYIASADKSGKVRIWDTVNKEHILKNEYQPISGPIKDLAWSSDNQRIVVVGEGREKFGHVFLADTGTSNGDITGQTRPVNSCDFKPTRPFRIVTGSEDNTSAVYEGPPFKFKGTKTEHSRYVQTVRYSPDGNFWASGGFDGKIFIYEAKASDFIGELHEDGENGSKNAHGGGVYGISWSPDSKKILSASGDKTCRVWEVETRKLLTEFVLGNAVEDQQLGCLWSGDHLISVALSGNITYLDPENPSKPKRIIEGHNKPITALVSIPGESKVLSAGSDGRVAEWDISKGSCVRVVGAGHESQVNGLCFNENTKTACTLGIDDTRRCIQNGSFVVGSEVKLGGQPKSGCCPTGAELEFVVTENGLVTIISNGQKIREEKVDYEPSCVSYNKERRHLAIGEGGSGSKVRVYKIEDDFSLLEETDFALGGGPITSVKYSPDSQYLVTSDGNRKVTLFDMDYERANLKEWGFHTAKVNCTAWSPNSKFIASGGLDCSIIVWSVEDSTKHCIIRSAHLQSQITGVQWLNERTLISSGQDANIKVWDISFVM